MKRLTAALLLLILPSAAFAFDAKRRPAAENARIGILRPTMQYNDGREAGASTAILRAMGKELRERGFDVTDVDMTYDEASRGGVSGVDYLVEVLGSDAYRESYGGVGVGNRNADVTLEVIVARVAGQLRVYDGATMDVLADAPISRRSTAILPTSLGLGDRHFFAVLALPVAQWAQSRRVARGAAHDAAMLVESTLRGE